MKSIINIFMQRGAKMKCISRNYCVITGEQDMEELYSFSRFPVHMLAEFNTSINDDLLFDMNIGISKSSGVIQITKLLPNNIIYKDSHSNAIGKTWREHHMEVAKIIKEQHPETVLEIGGATGILESIYNLTLPKTIRWVIVEPEPNPIAETNAEFIKGFFPENLGEDYKFDMFVHTHVMEHMYQPRDFMSTVSSILKQDMRMVFSVPNLKALLKNGTTSVLNFEHNIYLTEEYIDFLLSEYGFKIEDKQYFGCDHSIIYSVIKNDSVDKIELSNKFYTENKELFSKYISDHLDKIKSCNAKLKNNDGPVYLFGAHITTQYYIAFGLDLDRIVCILDNDKSKYDKRVCGTTFQVCSPSILKSVENPIVILPNGPYSNEIKIDIIENINENVEFWE